MFTHCFGFIDGKNMKSSDIELSLIAANGGKKENGPLTPDKAIVRNQFIEVLVRLSIDKYLKTQIVESPSEAVFLAFDKHFLPWFNTFDSHVWRKERLWREEIDCIYTRFES